MKTSNRTDAVDRFLHDLDHPLKAEIEQLRAAILDSNAEITECVKWKAPSFRYRGEDRVTFKLHPRSSIQLIFHRGVKPQDSSDFAFEDASGLLTWLAKDRAMVTLADRQAVEAQQATLIQVVNRWMQATTPER